MLNLVLVPREDPGFWLGWALLVIGLAFVALVYLAAAVRGRLRPSIASGVLYGALGWLIAGAIVMPLLGFVASPTATGGAQVPSDPMRGSFMMLDLGAAAPIAALIAWLMFGAVLGASAGSPPGDLPVRGFVQAWRGKTNTRSVRRGASAAGIAIVAMVAIVLVVDRFALAPASPSVTTTATLATVPVQSLPQGADFFSVIELSQPPGATLGPHVHTYSGVAYSLKGVATIAFVGGQTIRVAPGEAGFIIAGQAHAHRNADDQLPSATLALLIVALTIVVGLLGFRRTRLEGRLFPVALVLLIVVGTIGILNPESNDWLFISVRSVSGRGAEMPMATAARVFESPSVGPFAPGPYVEALDEITVAPNAPATNLGSASAAVIVVLDGQVEVQSAGGPSTKLGARGATVLQPGASDLVTATGDEPAHLLELLVTPTPPGS
jgi:quercetin dioxygenase-like cupin family protein